MFKTTGIDHVAVNTNDMEATLQFYCGILGMRLARTSRTGDGRRHYNVESGGSNAFAFFRKKLIAIYKQNPVVSRYIYCIYTISSYYGNLDCYSW